jgi:hypothetical protein
LAATGLELPEPDEAFLLSLALGEGADDESPEDEDFSPALEDFSAEDFSPDDFSEDEDFFSAAAAAVSRWRLRVP